MKNHTLRRAGFAAIAVAIVLAVIFGGWDGREDSSDGVQTNDAVAAESNSSGGTAEPPPSNTDRGANPDRSDTVADLNSAWKPAPDGNASAPGKVRDDLPATLMAVDRSLLESLGAGDQTLLPIGADETVVFSIDTRKHYDAYGVTSLKGSVRQNGTSLPVVITYGDDSTLATISTRSGTYELRGNESRAWLYRSRDLGIPGGPVVDYLIPDRSTPTPQVSEVSREVPAVPQ